MKRRWIAAACVACLLGGAVLDRAARTTLPRASKPYSPYTFDPFGRLVSFPGKTAVPCPRQDGRTEVLLALGQSNAANHAGQRYTGGPQVVNFFAGKCYAAASPLLGASGTLGESWTLLANKMMSAGMADNVVLVSSAAGTTQIRQWAPGGNLHAVLTGTVDGMLTAGYKPTRIVWHQGESDFLAGTSAKDYAAAFASITSTLRAKGVTAPIYATVATAGETYQGWQPESAIAQAQRELPGVRAVIDTDALVPLSDRYDGVHFSARAQERYTDALLQAFAIPDRSAPTAAR